MTFPATLLKQAQAIRLVCFDVDGVLTDGKIIYHSDGSEIKAFHVHDGAAIKLLMKHGFKIAIITGRSSEPVTRRVQELGITYFYHGVEDKAEALEKLIHDSGCQADQIAHVGDDLPDLCLFKKVALSIGVPNGHPALLPHLDYTTTVAAGFGVAREVAELILRANNIWQTKIDPPVDSQH